MWHSDVSSLVEHALDRVLGPARGGTAAPTTRLRRAPAGQGDWTTAVALAVADHPRGHGASAAALAERLRAQLRQDPRVAGVTGAPSAHVSLTLTDDAVGQVVRDLVAGRHRLAVRRAAAGPVRREAAAPVRLAHARSRSITRSAAAHGVTRAERFDAALLGDRPDRQLMVLLADTECAVADSIAAGGRPEPLRKHLELVAAAHGDWYARTRVTPRGQGMIEPVHRTRLTLNDAVTLALAQGLRALGLDAPEHL